MIDRRNELDNSSDDENWEKDIAYRLGLEPSVIASLNTKIDQENFENLISKSVSEHIDWFFAWMKEESNFTKLFTKSSSIAQIKRAVGLKPDVEIPTERIVAKLDTLSTLLKKYIQGANLEEFNSYIPNFGNADGSSYLLKARNFAIRLIPDLSFSFGLLSKVLIERANQKGIPREVLRLSVTALATFIREGLDSNEKLTLRKEDKNLTRVQIHDRVRSA